MKFRRTNIKEEIIDKFLIILKNCADHQPYPDLTSHIKQYPNILIKDYNEIVNILTPKYCTEIGSFGNDRRFKLSQGGIEVIEIHGSYVSVRPSTYCVSFFHERIS